MLPERRLLRPGKGVCVKGVSGPAKNRLPDTLRRPQQQAQAARAHPDQEPCGRRTAAAESLPSLLWEHYGRATPPSLPSSRRSAPGPELPEAHRPKALPRQSPRGRRLLRPQAPPTPPPLHARPLRSVIGCQVRAQGRRGSGCCTLIGGEAGPASARALAPLVAIPGRGIRLKANMDNAEEIFL